MAVEVGSARLDADTWQSQLEELLALQAVYDDDFSLLEAPGVQPPSSPDDCGSSSPSHPGCGQQPDSGRWLDAEALLMAGPPQALLEGGAGGSGASGSTAVEPVAGCFVAEALVHVDVPDGGLQLVMELPPQPPPPPSPPQPPPTVTATAAAAAEAAAGSVHESRADANGEAPKAGAAAQGRHPDKPANGGSDDFGSAASGDVDVQNGDGGWTAVKHQGPAGRARGGGGGGGRARGGAAPSGPGRGTTGRGGRSPPLASSPLSCPPNGAAAAAAPGAGRGGGRRGAERVSGAGEAPVAGGRSVSGDGGVNGSGRGGRGRGRGRGAAARDASGLEGRDAKGMLGAGPDATGGGSAAGEHLGSGRGHQKGAVELDFPGRLQQQEQDGAGAGGGGQPTGLPPAENGNSVTAAVAEAASPATSPSADPNAGGGAAAAAWGSAGGPAAAPVHQAPALVPFGASVQFLAPIRVTLTLPATYPASSPPAVSLQALWLSTEQAATLVSALQSQWEAEAAASGGGGSGPVLFTWLDWLRTEALSYLGVRQQLVLRATAAADMVRSGASAAAASAAAAAGAEGVAVSLLRYSARREREKFDESIISCSICLEEHLGARFVRLPECGDAFCAACITTHLRTQLAAGALEAMRCPAPACRRQLPPEVLQQLLSQDEFARWETLTLQRTLDKMEDLVYCPRCREPCLEDKDHCTLCPKCFYSFCSLCEDAWHPGRACLDVASRLALLEERRNRVAAGHSGGGGGLSALERARQELNRQNELKSVLMLKSTTKQCPMCSMGVEKIEGCNKMTCSYCGTYFCWKCQQPIRGYDHFEQRPGEEGSAGNCVLFDQEEIDRWNARWNAPRAAVAEQRGQMVQIMQRVDPQARFCNCVMCGQRNVKHGGNNDIRCWCCNSHFCYLCRTWLRNKPGSHFGPGKCRQHTDD